MDRHPRTLGALSTMALLIALSAAPVSASTLAPPPPQPDAGASTGGTDPTRAGAPAPVLPSVGPLGVLGGGAQSGMRTQASGNPMSGTFVVSDGTCGTGATPTGSYFSMLDPSGNPVDNGDSPCGDKSATPVAAGTEGLLPGRMQPFAGSPGATRAIVAPTTFFGSPFAVATQGPDKQSGTDVQAPAIFESGGKLSGQISAFQAFYNGAYYNQGAPKPGGSTPGRTTDGVSGSYDGGSGAFVLEWRSTITGGAFNNFTGVWHLEGAYKAAAGGASGGTSPSGGSSSAADASASSSGTTGTSSGATGAGPQGGGRLADTGLGAAGTGSTVLGLCAMTLALWWRRRVGWSS